MKKEITKEYRAGFDCGINGANEENCHFSLFATSEQTKEWEKGKKDADNRQIIYKRKGIKAPILSKKYPKVIFVQSQGEDKDEYLQAEREFKFIPDDGKVAIYELKEIKNRRTEIELF
ncbi:MAG: hypothetical protein UT82_C0028G0018 [Parcubacteria group bacterium GW2011_GWB1_40_14]|nr:MAG: hypothetical protein UT82_C0028G0018 [Parcubacteria group bacterium GW2011_GWB1_40_14]